MENKEKYQEISKLYGNALRIGMLESDKDKVKIAKLLRFESTVTNCTSLEEVRNLPIDNTRGSADSHSTSIDERKVRSRYALLYRLSDLGVTDLSDLLYGWSWRASRGPEAISVRRKATCSRIRDLVIESTIRRANDGSLGHVHVSADLRCRLFEEKSADVV